MPDHPSWPAELVEKAARELYRAPGWNGGIYDAQDAVRHVLSALSGDLGTEEPWTTAGDGRDTLRIIVADDTSRARQALRATMDERDEARSQAVALAEALERLDRAVVDRDGDDWHEHEPDEDCDDYCELMRALREGRSRVASYRSSSSTETEG